MRELNVGSLPVVEENHKLVGVVTDRDITVRATAEASDPNATAVRDIMTPQVTFCFDDQNVVDAAHLMEEKQIRRLIVLDRLQHLVGIVSLGDLAVKNPDERLITEALEGVSFPAAPVRTGQV
jgi:CBS domain-containing protein